MKLTIPISLLLLLSFGCTTKQPDTTTKPSPPIETNKGTIPPPNNTPTPAPSIKPDADQKVAMAIINQMYTLHFKNKQVFKVTPYKQWFDPELYRLLLKDEQESAKITDEIAGLDFNPITSAQDEVGAFTITVAKGSEREIALNVGFAEDVNRPRLTLEMVKNNDKWQIKNILYSNNNSAVASDLISILYDGQKQRDEINSAKPTVVKKK